MCRLHTAREQFPPQPRPDPASEANLGARLNQFPLQGRNGLAQQGGHANLRHVNLG